jgi:hypothetical protein
MAFLRQLLAEKPVRAGLKFGINENVRLVSITNEEKLREGEVIAKNTYMTFVQYDEKNVPIANSEFSYFNLNPDLDSEIVLNNFIEQISQLTALAKLYNPSAVIDPTEGYEDMADITKDLRTRKGCKAFNDAIYAQFEESVKEFIGTDSPLLRVKVVSDYKSGKYLQLPKSAAFAELLETNPTALHLTPSEIKNRAKSLEPVVVTSDTKGDTPDEAPKKMRLSGLL